MSGEIDQGAPSDVFACILGNLEICLDGVSIPVGHTRQKAVLAALLAEVNQVIPPDRLIDRVWGESAPDRARSVLRTYLSNLRRSLTSTGITITWRDTGYLLTADPDCVDLYRFRQLRAEARDTSDPQRALALVEQALALWRGEPLAELNTSWAQSVRGLLHRERIALQADRTDRALECGQHLDLVPELTAQAAVQPLDERLAGQVMVALYRSGRQADALDHFQHTRQRLVEELGSDPCAALQQIHQRILTGDPALSTMPAVAAQQSVVPRQLPAPPTPFVGRRDELDGLETALDASSQAAVVVISAIAGAGGIGKTWLALHWAHRIADQFPDGQLFVDLRGFSPDSEPTCPEVAVRGFLEALGVDPSRIPADLNAQAALYRSLVAGKRILVTLDNAASVDQVVPLLPGSPTCTVLVTSRRRLASLIDRYGARHLQLGVLTQKEARALLVGKLGAARLANEPGAVDELIELCGRYPLALTIAARYVHTCPNVPFAEFTAELRESGLDVLDNEDSAASLPAVLSWSLNRLTGDQRVLFALLAIAPGPDSSLWAAVSLAGMSLLRARKALRGLEDASLIERQRHGRYAMHDLVRSYAATIARRELSEPERKAALERVVDFYLHSAHTADRIINPHRSPIRFDAPAPGTQPYPVADLSTALNWMTTHYLHVLAAQQIAAAHHRHLAVWQLAWTMSGIHIQRRHTRDSLAVWQAAADSATYLTDPATRTVAHRFLGRAQAELGCHERAIDHLREALTLAEEHQDFTQQALTHHALAGAWGQQGNHQRALDHARHALRHCPSLDQPGWEADALMAVGYHSANLGSYDVARDNCANALALHRRHMHRHGEARALDHLGYIDHRTGDHARAIRQYRDAFTIHWTLGNIAEATDILDRLGRPHAAIGQHADARAAWRQALDLYRQQGRTADVERVQRELDALDLIVNADRSLP